MVGRLLIRKFHFADNTKNFSGAEIQGLVKSAISFALNRQINMTDLSKQIDETNLKVRLHLFKTGTQIWQATFLQQMILQHKKDGRLWHLKSAPNHMREG